MEIYKDDYTFPIMYEVSSSDKVYLRSEVDIREIPVKIHNWESIRDYTGKIVHVYVNCSKDTFELLTKYIQHRSKITIELEGDN